MASIHIIESTLHAEVRDALIREIEGRLASGEADVVIYSDRRSIDADSSGNALVAILTSRAGPMRAWTPNATPGARPIALPLVEFLANHRSEIAAGTSRCTPDPLTVLHDAKAWLASTPDRDVAATASLALFGPSSRLAETGLHPGELPVGEPIDAIVRLVTVAAALQAAQAMPGIPAQLDVDIRWQDAPFHAEATLARTVDPPDALDRRMLVDLLQDELGLDDVLVVARGRELARWRRAIPDAR